jgi:hypothetical protein
VRFTNNYISDKLAFVIAQQAVAQLQIIDYQLTKITQQVAA